MTTSRTKLDQWEKKLKSDVGEGDLLLSELNHTQQDLDNIGNLLANTAFSHLRDKRYTIDKTLHHVRSQWPLTFALYLVLEGIYHYESEDLYWHGPIEQLGIQQNQTHWCGSLFLNVLAQYDLPVFEQTRGHRYVTPILLHGGVPNDHLSDLFGFLLRYEIKPHRVAIDAETLLMAWRKNPEEHLKYLPTPVRRFLRYGGDVSTDFVARCLELFNLTTEEDAFELDLSERVLKAYWKWEAQHKEQLRKRPLQSHIHLQKPTLVIAPYTTGVFFDLPPQQFPTHNAPKALVWKISSGENIQRIDTTRQRVEKGYSYNVTQEVFVWPEPYYRVQLEADGEELRTWYVDGMDDPPLLIFKPFDDYEGDALNQDERHRSGRRWLLFPQKFKLSSAGRKIRDLPGLAGNWQAYRLEEWELEAGQLELTDEQSNSFSFTIFHEKSRRSPHLTDDNCLHLSTTRSDFPIYNGRPPHLIIPTTQAHRWRISVRAEGASEPTGYRYHKLSDLPVIKKNGEIWVDLADPKLLGEHPVGKFGVVARGPLGRSRSLGLRIVPRLEITGHDTLYLKEADQPACFHVTCDSQMRLRQNPYQDGVDIQGEETVADIQGYVISVQPDIQQVSLQLDHKRGPKIPLTIPVHRLRWGIKTKSGETTEWYTRPYSFFPDGLPSEAELRINVPLIAGNLLQVGWQLLKANGDVVRQVYPDDLRVQRRMRVSMSDVMASWREHQETLCWQIVIQKEGNDSLIIVDAFYLLPELNLGQMIYQWETGKRQINLTLSWEHPQLGQRQLRLWPLDRPWAEPITKVIPQTTANLVDLQFSNQELPSEMYLAEMSICNPWASQKPKRPERNQLNTLVIKPFGLDKYYAHLSHLRNKGDATPEQLIALLIHQHYVGQKDEMYETNKCLTGQINMLPTIWMIRWADTMRKLDKIAYKLTQIKIFSPTVIERLVDEDIAPDLLRQLFVHLSDRFGEKQCLWILQSGLHGQRVRCLESLCRLSLTNKDRQDAFHIAMETLLEDIIDGSLLVDDAVVFLDKNVQGAVDYLLQDGGQDAAELLRYLIEKTGVEPNCYWEGMTLNTDVGKIVISNFRSRETAQPSYCTPLKTNHYANGKLYNQEEVPMDIRLDLRNELVHFEDYEPYQCRQCNKIYRNYKKHHQRAHPYLQEDRRRIKRDWELDYIQPIVESEEAL